MSIARPSFWRALLVSLWLVGGVAPADEACRIAFDMGSSGIRAGASNSERTARAEIDFLAPLWAGRGFDELLTPTIAALKELPAQAGFDPACPGVGGGFSAWRLALQQDAGGLVEKLAKIREATGVAVLVVPPLQEGAYGYVGARALLGERLRSSHVLDIGGGSLQVAGEQSSFGEALGQKVWLRHLCHEIRNAETSPCDLQPLTGDELAIARALAVEKLLGLAAALPPPVSMTAISRPVSRGVLPAVNRLAELPADTNVVQRSALSAAIERIARLGRGETATLVGSSPSYVAYLLSDMLLVEALLLATESDSLAVGEIDLTNLPGLLADDRAYRWQAHYGCYLARLGKNGLAAYASDPDSCP
ncbi:MAG: hypothetical protein D3M94_12860 [Rhodocyclales bacterium GT-UBC]|nr:MAG: hypothetical protein D3M94_12860 [Rhodocyclales bacterium GT-UBC]